VDPGIEQAVERARRGDASAFDAIVLEYGTPLVRFLCGVLGGDVHAAHDVAQEAFLAAWRALPQLRDPRLLRSWIYRVAYHRAISWLRRRGPQGSPFRYLEADDLPEERAIDVAAPAPENGSEGPVTPRLRAALAALPPTYAAAVTLYYFQGLGTSEAAEALGVTRSTVKMRLHRARVVLRRTLLPGADAPRKAARKRASRAGGAGAALTDSATPAAAPPPTPARTRKPATPPRRSP